MRFVVVNGPPCAGKSTYVRDNMGARDVVFDYDRISTALTCVDAHTVNGRAYAHRYVMDMRSSFVDTAKAGTGEAEALWFILTNLTDKIRAWLESLNPEYIEMDVSEEECLRRLEKDDTRPDKDAWKSAIKKWFSEHPKKEENVKPINIRGVIVPNGLQSVYDFYGIEATCPAAVGQALTAAGGQPVTVIINSGGGDVTAGQEIYTLLRGYAGDVTIQVHSLAASAAAVIAMARTCEMSPVAQLMIHNVSTEAQGDYHDMEKTAEILKSTGEALATAFAAKTGRPMAEILELMDRETWLTAQRAVELGFADRIMLPTAGNGGKPMQLAASVGGLLPQKAIDYAMAHIRNNTAAAKAKAEYEFLILEGKAK